MYEYFYTPSKQFVGSRNPFLFLFVLIWHFNNIRSHFNSTEKMHRLYPGTPKKKTYGNVLIQ